MSPIGDEFDINPFSPRRAYRVRQHISIAEGVYRKSRKGFISTNLSSAKADDRFYVSCPREQIKRSNGAVIPTVIPEDRAVAGEGRGSAGDVYDALGVGIAELLYQLGSQTLARGIDHDDVGSADEGGRVFGGVACDEFGIFDAVKTGVVFCVLDGLGHDLNTAQNSAFGIGGNRKTDGAGSAVEVAESLSRLERGKLCRTRVKKLCHRSVDLIERRGGKAELQSAKDILDITVTVKGETYGEYSLGRNEKVEIKTELGTNTLIIENGEAYFTDSDCPDKTCQKSGKINTEGETIVCLPHKVIAEVRE